MTSEQRDALRKRAKALETASTADPKKSVIELAKIIGRLLDRMPVS